DGAGVDVAGRDAPDRRHPGLDHALVAEEVGVLHDQRVDRAGGQCGVLLWIRVEGDDGDPVGCVVVLDRPGSPDAGGVVVGEHAEQTGVGRQRVVDLRRGGVDVVVVVPLQRRVHPGTTGGQ